MPDPTPTPILPDSTFTEGEVETYASLLGVSEYDALEDLDLDSSRQPRHYDDQSKRNRNRAKAIVALLYLVNP